MDEIDTGYLIELQYLAYQSIDLQFQAWMATSFAVVVAAYTGRHDLGRNLRILMVALYLVAAYSLFARWVSVVVGLDMIQATLNTRGIDLEPVGLSEEARIAAYFIGTLSTCICVFIFKGGENRSEGT